MVYNMITRVIEQEFVPCATEYRIGTIGHCLVPMIFVPGLPGAFPGLVMLIPNTMP